MTIEKVGNKWRISKQHKGVRYRVSLDYKPTKKDAEMIIAEKISAEDPTGDRRDTFARSCEKYIQIKSNVLSPSTVRGYGTIMRSISDRFMNTKTCDISQELVQKEINDYSVSHSAKSTKNLHGFISAVLSVYRPSMKLNTTLPQNVKFDAYTPSESEIKQILDAVTGTPFEIPYRLGCYGLRRGEICALDLSDLDGNFISITKSKIRNEEGDWVIKPIPKTTGSQRVIYIDDELAGMIQDKGFIYKGSPNQLNNHLKILQERFHLPHFRFHDLRAYYASIAHALGIPDAYIMKNGGWTSTNILNRVYKRAIDEKTAAANQQIASHLGARRV
jgi:integrase